MCPGQVTKLDSGANSDPIETLELDPYYDCRDCQQQPASQRSIQRQREQIAPEPPQLRA
jgi:hypothetical protein